MDDSSVSADECEALCIFFSINWKFSAVFRVSWSCNPQEHKDKHSTTCYIHLLIWRRLSNLAISCRQLEKYERQPEEETDEDGWGCVSMCVCARVVDDNLWVTTCVCPPQRHTHTPSASSPWRLWPLNLTAQFQPTPAHTHRHTLRLLGACRPK